MCYCCIIPMTPNKNKTEVLYLLKQTNGNSQWTGFKEVVEDRNSAYQNGVDYLIEETSGFIGDKKKLLQLKPFYKTTHKDKDIIYHYLKLDLCERFADYMNNYLSRDRFKHSDTTKKVKWFTLGEIIAMKDNECDPFMKSIFLEDLHKFRSGLH